MSSTIAQILADIAHRFYGVDLQYRRTCENWPDCWRARCVVSKNTRSQALTALQAAIAAVDREMVSVARGSAMAAIGQRLRDSMGIDPDALTPSGREDLLGGIVDLVVAAITRAP